MISALAKRDEQVGWTLEEAEVATSELSQNLLDDMRQCRSGCGFLRAGGSIFGVGLVSRYVSYSNRAPGISSPRGQVILSSSVSA
jgi:hypothetical protein